MKSVIFRLFMYKIHIFPIFLTMKKIKLLNWGFKICFVAAILLLFVLDVKLSRNKKNHTISVKQDEQISDALITWVYLHLRKNFLCRGYNCIFKNIVFSERNPIFCLLVFFLICFFSIVIFNESKFTKQLNLLQFVTSCSMKNWIH